MNFSTFDLGTPAPMTLSTSSSSVAYISVPSAQFNEDKVLQDISRGWQNFVQSGQLWALLIGIVIGYMIRTITK